MVIPALIEGGKASAAPPLGPALGPSGLNIGEVIAAINEKTRAFAGISVPIKVIVDKAKKSYEIEVGTPPASALIKRELGLSVPVKEEAGKKGKTVIGNLSFDQLLKVCDMKKDSSLSKTKKALAKEMCGTCLSLGVTVDGMPAKEAIAAIAAGKYDAKLK